jgi:hypothetical protein
MQRLTATLSLGLVLALTDTGGAQPAGFASCDDAYNYAQNTARLYVSQSFGRVQCDAARRAPTEAALAGAFKRLVLRGSNSVAVKACFYQGLYGGYVDALRAEYERCSTPGFNTVGLDSIARAAESVFVALYGAIGSHVDECVIQDTFSMDYGFVPSTQEVEVCASTIAEAAYDDLASSLVDHLIEELVDVVCFRPWAE